MPTPPERLGGGGDGGRVPSRPVPDVDPDEALDRAEDEASAGFDPLMEPDVDAVPEPAAAAGFDAAEDEDAAEGVAEAEPEPVAPAVAADLSVLTACEDEAAATPCEAPEASLAGLAAALAMPAFDGLSTSVAALGLTADVAGVAPPADGVVPPAADVVPPPDGVAPLVVDLAPLDESVAVEDFDDDSLAPPLIGAAGCAAGSVEDEAAPPEVAALAALVVSP